MKIKRSMIERDGLVMLEDKEGKMSINPNDMKKIESSTKEGFLKAKQLARFIKERAMLRRKPNIDPIEYCRIKTDEPDYKKLMQMDSLTMLGEIEKELNAALMRINGYKSNPETAEILMKAERKCKNDLAAARQDAQKAADEAL